MNWKIKKFDELTTKELYEILRIRAEVFVVEQDCVYQDLDSKDEDAYHLFGEEKGDVVSYLRILQKGVVYQETAIGRVLTKKSYRKKGLSREMVQRAIDFITNDIVENEIRISAQAYLLKFYESFGFETTSDVYLEDGIEHIEMLYKRQFVD